jgi:hypothetical protein
MDSPKKLKESSKKDEFNDSIWVSENRYETIPQSSLVELVICPIIPHILLDPVSCPKCETHFCRKCLEKSMEKDSRCPVCRQDIHISPPQKILNNLLDRLRVHCFNFEKGCELPIKYSHQRSHREECLYQEVVCDRFRCGSTMLRMDLESHRKQCETELIACDYCQLDFTRSELRSHLINIICTEACQWCKMKVFRPALQAHEKVCDQIPILCLRCGANFFRPAYELHRDDCRLKFNINTAYKAVMDPTTSPLLPIPHSRYNNYSNIDASHNPSLISSSNGSIYNNSNGNSLYGTPNYQKTSYANTGSTPGSIGSRLNPSSASTNLLGPSNISNLSHLMSNGSQIRSNPTQTTPVKATTAHPETSNNNRKNMVPSPQYQSYAQQGLSSPRKNLPYGSSQVALGQNQYFLPNRR